MATFSLYFFLYIYKYLLGASYERKKYPRTNGDSSTFFLFICKADAQCRTKRGGKPLFANIKCKNAFNGLELHRGVDRTRQGNCLHFYLHSSVFGGRLAAISCLPTLLGVSAACWRQIGAEWVCDLKFFFCVL